MHRALLGLALGLGLSAPAFSHASPAAGFAASAAFGGPHGRGAPASGVRIHRLAGIPGGLMHDGRRTSREGFAYALPPGYYDANYDIDRSWDASSFNDWWHDRPDRAYPRWVWHNHHCTEDRMWWSGAGWRCTP